MVGPGYWCARDIGAALSKKLRKCAHAADRRLDTFSQRLRVSQEQGQNRESTFRRVERGISTMELGQRVLHDLDLEEAIGNERIVSSRDL